MSAADIGNKGASIEERKCSSASLPVYNLDPNGRRHIKDGAKGRKIVSFAKLETRPNRLEGVTKTGHLFGGESQFLNRVEIFRSRSSTKVSSISF
jgi:hypothetical protein